MPGLIRTKPSVLRPVSVYSFNFEPTRVLHSSQGILDYLVLGLLLGTQIQKEVPSLLGKGEG